MTQNLPPITPEVLLGGDRTLYQVCPGDTEKPANLTVAELKGIAMTLNISHERIMGLLQDLERAESRIDRLEQQVEDLTAEARERSTQELSQPVVRHHHNKQRRMQ